MARHMILRMSRETALQHGLIVCTCGHPPNNHFDHSKKPCAHCECKKYVESGQPGISILTAS